MSKHIDNGVFFVIGIYVEKSNDKDLYRTGHIVGLKRDCEFVQHLSEEYKKQDAVYMDYREMIKCGMIDIEEYGD